MYQTFDFADYLQRLTGVNRWLIEDLKGGDANYTARIRRGCLCPSAIGLLGCWDGCGSVILKQAPPFLAKVPSVSFSPRRQVVEAEALKLFSEANPRGLEPVLRCNMNIRVPKLILHDNQNCVIVQTDLGTHSNLYEVLITPSLDPILAASLGRTIGQFLAKMHNYFSGEDIGALVERFRHPDGDQVILSVIKKATELMQDAGVQDYQSLGNLAKHHWVTRKRNAFSQGDIWFGTLLVNLSNGDSTHPTIGICDWEFAGPNDHAADLAQLGSYLHLLSLSHRVDTKIKSNVHLFAKSMYEAYHSSSVISSSLDFLHSLLIMHGWEMINAAGWPSRQIMWCNCSGKGVKCDHVRAFIDEGAVILRAASGPSIDWQALLHGCSWFSYFRSTVKGLTS